MGTSLLIDRLTNDLGWARVTEMDVLDAYLETPGDHCLFLPGDPAKNLETDDAAVVLPELVTAFQKRFDVVVIDDTIERTVRLRYDVWPAPTLIFLKDGEVRGSIERIRNWDDYLRRITLIFDGNTAEAAE